MQHAPNRGRRIALHKAHVALHQLHPTGGHQGFQLLQAELVGGHLGLKVGQQQLRGAGRLRLLGQALPPGLELQPPITHQRPLPQTQPLIGNGLAEGRHRSRGDATHIHVVTTAGHKCHRLGLAGKDRRDGGDIRQMGAAMEGVVAEQGFTALQGWTRARLHLAEQIRHHLPHRAEMHRDVGRIGHQGATAIKQGAGEIKPLADVHRTAGEP